MCFEGYGVLNGMGRFFGCGSALHWWVRGEPALLVLSAKGEVFDILIATCRP